MIQQRTMVVDASPGHLNLGRWLRVERWAQTCPDQHNSNQSMMLYFVTITLKANAPQIIINIYYICLITWKILCLLWRQSWKLNKYIFFYLRAPYNRQLVELLARVWFVPVRPWSVSLAYNYTQCQALLQWHWRCWCGGDCVLICWHCWHKHRRLCHHLTGWTAPCKTSGPGTLYKDTLNKDVESSWDYCQQWSSGQV